MGAIKKIYFEISSLLQTTNYSIAEIAKELDISEQLASEIVLSISQQELENDYYVS